MKDKVERQISTNSFKIEAKCSQYTSTLSSEFYSKGSHQIKLKSKSTSFEMVSKDNPSPSSTACQLEGDPEVFLNKWDLTTKIAGSDVPSQWVANNLTKQGTTFYFDGMNNTCSADYDGDGVAESTDCDYVHWT
jgi:hypothetical protein